MSDTSAVSIKYNDLAEFVSDEILDTAEIILGKVKEGLYKMIVEAIMITSLEIIILMFVIVLELFPGNAYKIISIIFN